MSYYYDSADIFFVIASAGFIIVGILVVWGGILAVGILKDVRYISRRAKQESDRIVEDVGDLRSEIKKESKHVIHFFHSLGMLFSRTAHRRKVKK
jgi:hypothetical protein